MSSRRVKNILHIANIIQSEVVYFNGRLVDQESEREACENAGNRIEQYIKGRIRRELKAHGVGAATEQGDIQ